MNPDEPEVRDLPWRVREAREDDLPTLVDFNRSLARETEGREPDPETLQAGVRALFDHPDRGRYYLAEPSEADPGERPVAGQTMVTFEWSDWRNGHVWWIQSVYVRRERRRRGVYRALHRHVRREARRQGAVGLRLYVDRDNEAAHATYRSLGMSPSRYRMFEELWSDV